MIILIVLFFLAVANAAAALYADYQARPGVLEKIWIADRGGDYITVAWNRVKNVSKYVVTYNGETIEVSGRKKEVKITGLTPDTEYEFFVRADSRDREGFEVLDTRATTKKVPAIEGETSFLRFANRPVDLKQTSVTPITYSAEDGSVKMQEDGRVIFTKPGEIKVTATTAENDEYAPATKEITVSVLDTVNNPAAGAAQHVFYKLNKENCQLVSTITGVEDVAIYPQAFIRLDGKYLITYIKKNDSQRLITFGSAEGDKKVYEPKQPLGHANGLTIANGKCYLVEGFSGKVTTFDPVNDNYSSFELPASASGIAYDPTTNMFYTSSRAELISYDSAFHLVSRVGRINRTDNYFVQDSGAYGGILMQGVSGPDEQKTNWIDFYDMTAGTYIGSAELDLNELESIIVDEEGYIEVVCNAKGATDYIWKTPINMKALCD